MSQNTPMTFNRTGPATPPQMQLPANAHTFLNSPYNYQAQMLSAGNPGQGMYGFSSQLPNSYMMQRFLPEVTRHAMGMQNPFPYQYQTPWSLNGRTATFNPGAYGQQQQPAQPPGQPPTQPPQNNALRDARQAWMGSLTPEQQALRGGDMGNQDFRQSLTPQQMQLRQQVMDLRNAPQPAPMPGQPAAMPSQGMPQQGQPSPMPQNMAAMMRSAPQMPSAMQGMPQMGMPQQRGMAQFNPQTVMQMFQRMGMNLGMGY